MFTHPVLTWGFFLALVPLLIHLINLVRRRRVKWAAMEFLLQSYKKHQKWIWLQQLLLLFLRMAAVAVAVAMLAQWIARSHWLSLFGGQVTHHYVLLDDSFSMSERFAGVSAFDKAMQSLSRLAAQAISQESSQKFTLVRFSRAQGFRRDDTSTAIGQLADLNAVVVDARFDEVLEEAQRSWQVTQLATGPRVAWELVIALLKQSRDETNVVHVLSDFRAKDWSQPTELKMLLSEMDEISEQIQFVNCAPESQQSNLAVVDLRPADEIRAAGVPFRMSVAVANHGTEIARKVPLRIRSTFYDPQLANSGEPGKYQGHIEEPPAVLIDELPPGQTTVRQVQVFFPGRGDHVVEALLPDDVVAVDNRRWCVVQTGDAETVLVIDGDPDQRNHFYLSSVFQPGPRVATGVRVELKPPSFLRDAVPESLSAFHAVYLLDVDRLEERAVENLESFAKAGGGIVVFVGERVQQAFYTTRLFRGGEGFFPLPLEREDTLPPDIDEDVPDIEFTDHPLFSIFQGERNPFSRLVNVDRYLRPGMTWSPDPDSTVSVIARLRNRRPLAVERRFGAGRVVVFLTTLAPDWNNWGNENPSFVVVLLKLQAYVAAPLRNITMRLVGSELTLPTDPGEYRKEVAFVVPGPKNDVPIVLQRSAALPATPAGSANPAVSVDPAVSNTREPLLAKLPGTSLDDANAARSGIYEVWRTTIAGPYDVRRFAFNVDPVECDIAQVSTPVLLANLAPIPVRVRRADEIAFDLTEQAGFSRATWLMIVLVAMLLGEQLLAYFASYHPQPAKGVARA